MKPDSRRVRLAVAILSALAALIFSRPIGMAAGAGGLWMTLLAGVIFAAWYGGMKPGLIATAMLLAAGLWLAPIPPEQSLAQSSGALEGIPPTPSPQPGPVQPSQEVRFAALFFVAVSTVVCVAMQRLRMERFRSEHTQARLRQVLDSTFDAVLSVDPEFRCQYANIPAAKLAKQTPGQMYSRSLRTIFPETPGMSMYRDLSRAFREQAPAQFEHRNESTGRRYDIRAWPSPAGLTLFIRDVTSVRESELARQTVARELEAEHRRYRTILQNLPSGVALVSPTMQIEFLNASAQAILGGGLAEGLQLPEPAEGCMRLADGTLPAAGSRTITAAVADGKRLSGLELELTQPDGSTTQALVECVPLAEPSGRRPGALLIYSDIAPLRAAQKAAQEASGKLRRIFDNPLVGMVVSQQERIVDANRAFLAMTGYQKEAVETSELWWSGITPAEYRDLDTKAMGQLMARGFAEPYSKEILDAVGRRIPVRVASFDFESRGMFSWIAFVADRSEQRQSSQRLAEAARLESTARLATGLAHDFQNLMTSVTALASEALEDIDPGRPGRESLLRALRTAEKAGDLAGQLMGFGGRGNFAVGPISVADLVREMADLIRAAIPKHVELRTSVDPDLPPVTGDSTRLQQLLMNLVLNGAQAAGSSPGSVSVSVGKTELEDAGDLPDGTYILIAVEDTGGGMDRDTREHIFDPFFTTKDSGHGLGLAAALDTVREHKGAIRVASTPGASSRFDILLPAADIPWPPLRSAVEESPDWGHEGGTVLVVDGDEAARNLAGELLGDRGYTVIKAADWQTAIEICRGIGHSISLILLDLHASGTGTLQELDVLGSRRPVLVTSGTADGQRAIDAAAGRAAGFVSKPYDGDSLAASVRRALDREDD